jgi:hypothetical protein
VPWSIEKRGSKFCVVKQGETKPVPGGCHPTKEKAVAHQRALYASESVHTDHLLQDVTAHMISRMGEPGNPSADLRTVYAGSVNEGSDMTTTSNSEFSVTTVTNLADQGFEPLLNGAGQTVGFLNTGTFNTTSSTGDSVEKPWSGVLAVIGHPTGDKRYLMPGEIGNRDLPIPLQVQTVTGEGHDGAHTAGRIDQIEFIPMSEFDAKDAFNLDGVPEDATVVFATGMLDGSPAALEAERLIANGAGISVDLPADRMALIDPDTFEEVDPADVEMADVLSGKYLTGIGGKIAAATIVTIPAFEEAEIGLTEEESVLVASAYGQAIGVGDDSYVPFIGGHWATNTLVAMAAPLKPDPDWFADPKLKKLTPLTITPEGRVYGHLADWDGCHTGFSNVCVPPFRSETAYAYFNTGEIECEDGSLVAVGKLMFSMEGGKHAPTWMSANEASQHYDDSTKVGAFVRAGTDRYGTWLAGALRPGLSDEEVQHLRLHPPSGDWRPIPNKGTELVAAFCVAVGGFPIPRAMVASGAEGELTIISAPLDLELGPHAVRRRFEVLKRKRKAMRPYSDD